MLKVAKFGGSSMADAGQYQKIRDIIRSDPSRRVVVVSAAGKRSAGDNKITDLLYLCYAHLQYGVSCDGIYQMIRERYGDIHRELGLRVDLEGVLDRLRSQMEQGISRDELVSRGEYLSALLMADYLGFTFVPENFNLISITGMHIGKQSFYGQGAGRFPTAYNVMQDCLDIRNGLTRFYTDKLRPARVDNSSIMRPYYVRVNGMDRWLQTRIDKMLDCGIITTPVAVSEIHAWARERKLTETGGFLASLR